MLGPGSGESDVRTGHRVANAWQGETGGTPKEEGSFCGASVREEDVLRPGAWDDLVPVSYTHLRAHETEADL
eukprot:3647324-Rhodomonas_salina.1